MKCFSFFKVGGGFRAEDFATIKHITEGKWHDWDRDHPPTEFIELAGGDRQLERPDVWIKPCDSVVVEVKGASVGASDSFRANYTVRFPRFKKLRTDKDWKSALSLSEFAALKAKIEQESAVQREFEVDKRRAPTKRVKKELVIAGTDNRVQTPYAGPKTAIFEGLNFCVMTEMLHPQKKRKAEIEQIIKVNGGNIFQSPTVKNDMICLGEKRLVPVASLIRKGDTNVVKPVWVLDALKQTEIDGPERAKFLLPFEPNHMFHLADDTRQDITEHVDDYGDSYARDVTPDELKEICDNMILPKNFQFSATDFVDELEEHGHGLGEMSGSMFARCVVRFFPSEPHQDIDFQMTKTHFLFGQGVVTEGNTDKHITQYVVLSEDGEVLKSLKEALTSRIGKVPRIVGLKWLQDSWSEQTLLDEERYSINL